MKRWVVTALCGLFPWVLLFLTGVPWERGADMAFIFTVSVVLAVFVYLCPGWEGS